MTTDMTYKLMTRGPSDERTLFAHLSMGAHQTVIGNVILNRLEANDRRKVVQAFGEPSTMWFKRICSADDFKAYVPLDGIGRIFAGDVTDPKDAGQAEWSLIDDLRLRVSGGIVLAGDILVLVYPVGMEAWAFIETSPPAEFGTIIRLQLIKVKPRTHLPTSLGSSLAQDGSPTSSVTQPRSLRSVMRGLYHVEYKQILARSSKEGPGRSNFFILVPPRKSAELYLYVDFLKSSGAKNIYTVSRDGAWDYFGNQCQVGTVLIHPSFTAIHRLPNLAQLIRKGISMFKFGIDPISGFVCSRLFPHGGAILLTDSLILENPVVAEKIVRWFAQMVKIRAPNTWKLAGRPGLKDWVLSVADEKSDQDGLRSEKFQAYRIWITLDELLPPSLITYRSLQDENDTSIIPMDEADLVWEDIPGYDDDDDDSSSNDHSAISSTIVTVEPSRQRQQQQALDRKLANWFCGWAFQRIHLFRKFVIVHPTAGDDLRFSQAVDVVTPERFFIHYN